MGPNYVLDKGFFVKSNQTGIKFGKVAIFDAAATGDRIQLSAASDATAATFPVGIIQEDLDDAKVATGKSQVNVRMLGISRAISGAALAKGTAVKADAQGRLVAAAGVGVHVVGTVLTTCSAADQWVDVLVTPGVKTAA